MRAKNKNRIPKMTVSLYTFMLYPTLTATYQRKFRMFANIFFYLSVAWALFSVLCSAKFLSLI